MGLLDSPEEIIQRPTEKIIRQKYDKWCWDKFRSEEIEPRLKKINAKQLLCDFAVGVYVPTDFVEFELSLYALCQSEGVNFYSLDCDHPHIINQLSHFVRRVTRQPFSVILLKNIDKVPDNLVLEKEYIENILVRSWESNFFTYCKRFLAVFTTSEDYSNETPDLLKNINHLKWYGNIRRYKVE